MKYLLCLCGVAALTGCAGTNSMNSEWKSSLAQLQITPVLPLRQTLAPGEVYRYLDKPGSFASDGQLEPVVAFTIDNLVPAKADERIWPTFSYKGGSKSSLKAASKAAGMLSGQLDANDTINITVSKGFAQRVSATAVIAALCDIGPDGTLRVKNEYHERVRASSELTWKSWGRYYKRNVIFVRIPTEVYFAQELHVTASKDGSGGGSLAIDEAKLKTASAKLDVAFNTARTVSLVETFPVPMAIGYRGILLRIWPGENMRVEEFPEDAGHNWFNSL